MARPNNHTTRNGKGVVIYRIPKKLPSGEIHFGADWIRRKTVANKTHYFNLGPDKAAAASTADELETYMRTAGASIEEARRRFDSRFSKRAAQGKDYQTIGDLLATHTEIEHALDLKPAVAVNYRGSLLLLIRYATSYRTKKPVLAYRSSHSKRGFEYPEEKYSVTVLDASLVHDFKLGFVGDESNLAQAQARKRSANSIIRNARAVFSDAAMEHYRALKLPDMAGFLGVRTFKRVDRAKRYAMPAPTLIVSAFKLAAAIEQTNPSGYAVFFAAAHAGLRREEAGNAETHWLLDSAVHVQAGKDFTPKSTYERMVPVKPWAIKKMRSFADTGYLVKGAHHFRTRIVPSRFCADLRTAGFNRRLPLHEMRKLFGSYLATSENLFIAQKALGHATAQITSDTYAEPMDERLFILWEKPWSVAIKDPQILKWSESGQ